jgi:hypothetical protein
LTFSIEDMKLARLGYRRAKHWVDRIEQAA